MNEEVLTDEEKDERVIANTLAAHEGSEHLRRQRS